MNTLFTTFQEQLKIQQTEEKKTRISLWRVCIMSLIAHDTISKLN